MLSSGTISERRDGGPTPRSTTPPAIQRRRNRFRRFAGAAGRRAPKEVTDGLTLCTRRRRHARRWPAPGLRTHRAPTHVGRRRIVAFEKKRSIERTPAASAAGSGSAPRGRCRESTGGRAAPADASLVRIEVAHVQGRMRAHNFHRDSMSSARWHPTECQPRRAEPDDLRSAGSR